MLRRLGVCGGAILLLVMIGSVVSGDASPFDNGWRRTAQGWELLHVKPVVAAAVPLKPSRTSAHFHPLLLAALQVGLVAGAYWRFPVKK
ncbi:MAG: hypothetical protein ACKVP0_07695 [Pirellulaceae bacterium]